jgi:hypothetical protein
VPFFDFWFAVYSYSWHDGVVNLSFFASLRDEGSADICENRRLSIMKYKSAAIRALGCCRSYPLIIMNMYQPVCHCRDINILFAGYRTILSIVRA